MVMMSRGTGGCFKTVTWQTCLEMLERSEIFSVQGKFTLNLCLMDAPMVLAFKL